MKLVFYYLIMSAGKVVSGRDNVLDIPSKMFISAPVMEKLLAHHVIYLNAQLQPQSAFGQFLGIKTVPPFSQTSKRNPQVYNKWEMYFSLLCLLN